MSPETIAAFAFPFSIASMVIVPILARHQRKMAELIHSSTAQQAGSVQASAVQQELQQLKDQVARLTIEVDNLKRAGSPSAQESVRQRIAQP